MSAESQRLRQAERLEILALALLAVVPIVPYLAHILDRGIPRFDLAADFALQEYDVRHVWHGETLLGLGSRWRWSHPGPLLFYFIAPFQKAFGASSTGLYVGTWALAATSVATIVAATRKWAGRPHAVAALVVVLCWFSAFGNVAHNPWVRLVLALPLFAYVVLTALFASGAAAAAIAAVPFGCIVTQTHVLTTETVGVIGVAALAAFVLSARRRGGLTRAEKKCLLLAVVLLVVLFLPPLVEELRAGKGEGNIDKLIAFQRHRAGASKPLRAALDNWTVANSWLADRILSGTIPEEGAMPLVMRWDPVPPTVSRTAWTILAVQVASCTCAAVVAYRRRDRASLALLGLGVLGSLLGIHSVCSMAGQEHYSLLFWTVAPSAASWIGVGSTCIGELWRSTSGFVAGRRVRGFLVALGLTAVLAATAPQRAWLAHHPDPTGSHPTERVFHRAMYDAVRDLSARANAIPVIHQEGAWADAFSVLLEYDKDGIDVRIADVDAWVLPGSRRASPEGRFLHFWFANPEWPVRVAPCLELAATIANWSVYTAEGDVVSCAPRR